MFPGCEESTPKNSISVFSWHLFRVQAKVQIWKICQCKPAPPLNTVNFFLRSANIAHNDVAGNYSLTLIDVLDTFIVLDDRRGFETAVRNVINWVSFDVNTKPQLFEITIRVLGGLLSAHTFARQTGGPFYLSWYRGQLLDMAHDLGERLLPAFSTPTGIPYARVPFLSLSETTGCTLMILFEDQSATWRTERRIDRELYGIPSKGLPSSILNPVVGTAGAGSLMLEFATLSRLTGDYRFEKAAHKAFFALWNRRSDIGLVGNAINILDGVCSVFLLPQSCSR
jgi:ER degradation enhancer, mannosidase alpha-like 1